MESYLHQENQRENDFSAGLRVEVQRACGKGRNEIHKMLCNAGEVLGNMPLCIGSKHLNKSAKLEM